MCSATLSGFFNILKRRDVSFHSLHFYLLDWTLQLALPMRFGTNENFSPTQSFSHPFSSSSSDVILLQLRRNRQLHRLFALGRAPSIPIAGFMAQVGQRLCNGETLAELEYGND